MNELEKLTPTESLAELSKDEIEKMDDLRPLELMEGAPQLEKPDLDKESLHKQMSVSFKGLTNNCICSCVTTCTRA